MFRHRRLSKAAVAVMAALSFGGLPDTAKAYPVDCAILLCLSGGWPASAECAHARAVFIRRITPWPIEPPLQIWRCPMGVSFQGDASPDNWSRLFEAASRVNKPNQSHPSDGWHPLTENAVPASVPSLKPQPAVLRESGGTAPRLPESFMLQLIQQGDRADIDISGSEFDFVRSIRVWDVRWYSHNEQGRDDECREWSRMYLGTYGAQGEFAWRDTHPGAAPTWVIPSRQCGSNYRRGVGVEWRDYEGAHGYEWVSY